MDDCYESDIVFKWTHCCRLCLANNADIDIFDSDDVFNNLLSKFDEHLKLVMYRGDPMPRKICQSCNNQLEAWHLFKAKCLETDINLKKRMEPYRSLQFIRNYLDKSSSSSLPNQESGYENQELSPFVTIFKKEPLDAEGRKDSVAATDNIVAESTLSAQILGEPDSVCSENDNSVDTVIDDFGRDETCSADGLNILRQMAVGVNESAHQEHAPMEETPSQPLHNEPEIPKDPPDCPMEVDDAFSENLTTDLGQVAHVPTTHLNSTSNEVSSAITDANGISSNSSSSSSSHVGILKVRTSLSINANFTDEKTVTHSEPTATAEPPTLSVVSVIVEESVQNPLTVKQEPVSPNTQSDAKLYNLRPRGAANSYGEVIDWPEETSTPPPRPSRQKVTPWKCELCTLYFASIQKLMNHQASPDCAGSHMDSYSCLICAKKFSSENNLAEHNVRHIKIAVHLSVDELRQCRKCDLAFADPWRVKQHALCHLQKSIPSQATQYPCEQCGLLFLKKTQYDEHLKRHLLDRLLLTTAPQSQSSYISPQISEPEDTKISEREISCSLCIARFKGEDLLYDHRFAVHGIPDERVACPTCSTKFRDNNSLAAHVQTHHKQPVARKTTNPFFKMSDFRTLGKESGSLACGSVRCRRCGMVFYSREELARHESEKHKNAMPFLCRKCTRRFPTRSLLLLHHREHLSSIGNVPLARQPPLATAPAPVSTVTSLDPQTSRQPYIIGNRCQNCSLTFKCDADLQEHVTSHLKFGDPSLKFRHIDGCILRYQCSGCPQLFSQTLSKIKHSIGKHESELIDFIPLQIPITRSKVWKTEDVSHAPTLQCSICGLELKSQASLNFHVKIKHTKKQLTEENPIQTNVLENHSWDTQYQKCPCCPLMIALSSIRQHMLDQHPMRTVHSCKFCPKICSSRHNLGTHEVAHTKPKTKFKKVRGLKQPAHGKCRYCDKTFAGRAVSHLKRHETKCRRQKVEKRQQMTVTPPTPPQSAPPAEPADLFNDQQHRCSVCGNNYETSSLLQLHSMTAHGVMLADPCSSRELWQEEQNKIVRVIDGVQRCTLCHLQLDGPEAAAWHRSQHPRGNLYMLQVDESLYQCTACDQLFNNRASALRHASEHAETDVKPTVTVPLPDQPNFNCPFCESTFSCEQSIRSHMYYVHSGGSN